MNENGKYGVKTWSQVVFLKRVAHLDGAHADLKKQVEAEYIALDLLLPFTFLGLLRRLFSLLQNKSTYKRVRILRHDCLQESFGFFLFAKPSHYFSFKE